MATQEKPTPSNRAVASSQVKVRVVKQPVHHAGRTYLKGQSFELEAERAEAFGELVVPDKA